MKTFLLQPKLSTQKGFTIIEIVIVVFLAAILLVGLLSIFDWQNKVYQLEQADIFATGSARDVMNNMTTTLAQGINIVASRVINGTTYTTGGSTIVVQIPSYDSSNNVITDKYDYVVFTQDGTKLNQVVDLDPATNRKIINKLLSDKIQTFALTYNNADPTLANQVTVDLTTNSVYRSTHSVSAHLKETIFLRNK